MLTLWLLPNCLALLTDHGAGGGAQPESPRVLSDIGHGRDRAGDVVTTGIVALRGERFWAWVAYRPNLIT